MDIINYAVKLVSENYVVRVVSEFGQHNPVTRVASDLSEFFKKVKENERKQKRRGVTINPIIEKAVSDIEKTYHPYSVKNVHPVRPNDHYLEIMQLKGWLDLDLGDPDLKPLFK